MLQEGNLQCSTNQEPYDDRELRLRSWPEAGRTNTPGAGMPEKSTKTQFGVADHPTEAARQKRRTVGAQ